MANQPEQVQYDAGVYQLETTDPVDGGVGAVSNKPLLNLANRTAYLKQHVDNLENGTTIPPTVAPLNSPAFTGTPTGPTAPLGDNTTKLATDAFVQGTVNGVSTISVAGSSNVNLTAVQAGAGILVFTGALTGNISVIVPNTSAKWEVSNQTTGAFTLTVKTAAGSGVLVAQGKNTMLWCDGVNVLDSKTDFQNTALTGNPTAPTAASGDDSTSIANTGFVFNATDGMAGVNVAGNVDVTLTQAQYGSAILNLTGALTANINLKFPQQSGQWIVANNSTGAFAITAKTTAAGGGTAVLPQGSAVIVYSDGTNMFFASSGGQTSFTRTSFTPSAGTTTLTVPTGYTAGNILIEKNGAVLEPADFTATNGSTITLTTATVAGDVINVYAFKSFSVANAVLRSGDTMAGPLALFGGDTGTTAAQFDSSSLLATTSFVQRALGSWAGQTNYAAAQVLSAADIGKVIVASGNITLPVASTAAPGSRIKITANLANRSISPQGTDTITLQNGTIVGSVTVTSQGYIVFERNLSGTSWNVAEGDASLQWSPYFVASLAVSGYQKLPSGLIIQWGSVITGAGGSGAVTFPIAFPNGFLSASLATAMSSVSNPAITGFSGQSTTGMTLWAATPGSVAFNGCGIYYIAVGH